MKLSLITSRPDLFQLREARYSTATVEGIIAEGIDLAKWSDLPIVSGNEVPGAAAGTWIVAGDGHSRHAALQRLAVSGQLPAEWKSGDDWEIPCKMVSYQDTERLMLANLCREDLTPAAEARGFQLMRDRGLTDETIATRSHKKPDYIKRMLRLNTLAECIKERIGKPGDAGGISKDCAMVLAVEFDNYGIKPQQQQEIYNKVLAHSELTPGFIRGLLKKLGPAMKSSTENALFAIPATVEGAVKTVQDKARAIKRAAAALATLMALADDGILDSCQELLNVVQKHGQAAIDQFKYEADADAAVIGKLCLAA